MTKQTHKAGLLVALTLGLAACGGGDATPGQSAAIASSSTSGGSSSSVSPVAAVPAANYSSQEKTDVFNRLNDDRSRCGFGRLAQNARLDTAAQSHADYMVLNNVYSHNETLGNPGFTGATPGDRFTAAGYAWSRAGEAIGASMYGSYFVGMPQQGSMPPYSTTTLSATNTLRLLYSTVYHLAGLTSGNRDVGIGVSTIDNNSDPRGTATTKYAVIDSGVDTGSFEQAISADAVVTFPCEGTTGINPYFGPESPDPFPNGPDRSLNPYGQPVYLMSGPGTTLSVTSARITRQGGADAPITVLTKANDPQNRLTDNQVFVVPTQGLAENATYLATISGTTSGKISASNPTGAFTVSFTYQTSTFTAN